MQLGILFMDSAGSRAIRRRREAVDPAATVGGSEVLDMSTFQPEMEWDGTHRSSILLLS
jgi:hypothetical protein